MVKKIKEFVHKNATLLFKTSEKNLLKAVFDKKGFWFNDQTQPIYDAIKNEPHIYVAFNKHGYYIGISNQSGGRWKRLHAYHLGTLAYHLLGTSRYDDQNHLHWIEAWMKIESLKLDSLQNTISLKEEVYICFIPFKLYSGFNNHHTGNSLPPKNIIKKINKEFEAALIQSYQSDGKKLLNVQNSKNKKPVLQTKTGVNKIPPPKNPIVAIGADFVGDYNSCIEFKVSVNQSIHDVVKGFANLPNPSCFLCWNTINPNQKVYASLLNQGWKFTGRNGSQNIYMYFSNSDKDYAIRNKLNGTSRWKIIQEEMVKNNIKEITVRVCQFNSSKTK